MTALATPVRPAGHLRDSQAAFDAGLVQLTRYLARTWSRAGVDRGRHDDCTQAVPLGLIEVLGPARFRDGAGGVGRRGVRAVLGREAAAGPDFLRMVDRVKKRALRARHDLPLDLATALTRRDGLATEREALSVLAGPGEADLVAATLAGDRPAVIATRWGGPQRRKATEKSPILGSQPHLCRILR